MDRDEIRKRARAGTWYVLSQRGLVVAVNLLSSVTFARLLPPEEFGIAAMAMLAFSFLAVFRSFGLSSVTVQKAEITQEEINFLFWVNVLATTLLAAVAAALSPWLADFFDEPRVRDIMLVTCLGFLVGGYSAQYNALLRRELRFDVIVRSESVGLLLGFVAGLGVAIWRHDAWAVVAAGGVHSFVTAVSNIRAVSWKPGRPRGVPDARNLLHFGANLTVYSALTTLAGNVAPLLIGRIMGATALGFYNRGYQLFQIPNTAIIQPVMSVMMPVLSRLQTDQSAYRGAYLSLVEKLSCLLLPAAIGLFFAAPSLTRVLLGPGWEMAGEILSWLAPALAAQSITGPAGPLMTSLGRSAELRSWGIIDATFRATGTLLGLWFGIVGSAVGLTVATLLSAPLVAWLIGRKGPVSFGDQIRAAAHALPIALGALGACLVAAKLVTDAHWPNGAATLMVMTGAGFAGGMAGGLCTAPTRRILMDLLKQVHFAARIKIRK
jgi:PST family polysaccharide transporter